MGAVVLEPRSMRAVALEPRYGGRGTELIPSLGLNKADFLLHISDSGTCQLLGYYSLAVGIVFGHRLISSGQILCHLELVFQLLMSPQLLPLMSSSKSPMPI